MTTIESTTRLPNGWTCDTTFVVSGPIEDIPKRATVMRELYLAATQGVLRAGDLIVESPVCPAQTCKALLRLVWRGALEVER